MENILEYSKWREQFFETNVTKEAKEDANNQNGIAVSDALEELIKQEYQHYLNLLENRHTFDEIYDMTKDPSVNFEFANCIRGVSVGFFQAIRNAIHQPETMEKCFYENDPWNDGYNLVVEKYEKYCKKGVDD